MDVGASLEVRPTWMYVKVASRSCVLGGLTLVRIKTAIDPTRLNKGRKFAPNKNPNAGSTDTSLWTETPAERQQRLADELSGKKRRKENSEVPDDGGRGALEARKRQKTEGEIQRAVAEHNVRVLFAFPPFSSLTSIVEEKSTRLPVAYAREGPGNYTTEIKEGRRYMGPLERYGPIRTPAG